MSRRISFNKFLARRSIANLLLAIGICCSAPAQATNSDGLLTARPSPSVSLVYAEGESKLRHNAILYRPSGLRNGPQPLIVVLHGFPGTSRLFLDWFKPTADREKALLLALQSRGNRWDLVPDPAQQISRRVRSEFQFGPDVAQIDEVLRDVFARAPVDPAQIVLVGFSDGGSYALSLGLANYQVFRSIIALSPGFVRLPARVAPAQRIVISSGRSDTMLPYDVVALKIVPLLVENQLHPRFCSFEGGHVIPLGLLRDAMGYALGRAPFDEARTRSARRSYECVSN